MNKDKDTLPKWLKKLEDFERNHLKECLDENRFPTLCEFKAWADYQRQERQKYPRFSEPCDICKGISIKLGLPV